MAAAHELLLGSVAEFDVDRGIGTIRPDGAAESLVFHCTQILDGTRRIDVGAAVAFEVGPGGPGRWEARRVVKLAPDVDGPATSPTA